MQNSFLLTMITRYCVMRQCKINRIIKQASGNALSSCQCQCYICISICVSISRIIGKLVFTCIYISASASINSTFSIHVFWCVYTYRSINACKFLCICVVWLWLSLCMCMYLYIDLWFCIQFLLITCQNYVVQYNFFSLLILQNIPFYILFCLLPFCGYFTFALLYSFLYYLFPLFYY